MPLLTNTALTVTPAEAERADRAFADLDAARARIISLEVELASRPLAPPAPLPPAPVPAPAGRFRADGAKFRRANGTVVVPRGVELMYGTTAAGTPALCATVAAWGANVISPLFQPATRTVAAVNAFLAAARVQNLIVGFNADHARADLPDAQRNEAQRAWLCEPAIVSACNAYLDLFLEIEVELGGVTDASWVTAAQGLIDRLRAAGHLSVIKLGSGSGGRDPSHAIRNAAQLRDPLGAGRLAFTCQAYYEKVVAGWSYQQDVVGLTATAADPGCAKSLADLMTASGLPFIVGLDAADDVGVTLYAELAPELKRAGIGWQWWVLTGDFRQENNLVDWDLNPVPAKSIATQVSALLRA